jgi:hypothetical protein
LQTASRAQLGRDVLYTHKIQLIPEIKNQARSLRKRKKVREVLADSLILAFRFTSQIMKAFEKRSIFLSKKVKTCTVHSIFTF